jgi:hypothetical protein
MARVARVTIKHLTSRVVANTNQVLIFVNAFYIDNVTRQHRLALL